jgi:DNA-binding NtrC family response regulator
MQRTILLVDDERNMLTVTRMALEDAGYRVLTAERAEDAIPLLRDPDLDVILSDLKMPGMSGEEFVAHCRRVRPEVPVIVVTAYGSIRSAVECIQAGASDYLTKPFEPEELEIAIEAAVRLHDLMQENRQLQAAVSGARPTRRLVGASPAMERLREEIARVAPYKTTVLITGESGTGKEAVARTIHESSPRAERPWVAINCSAIPRDLMESELFGYAKGAFTGAVQTRLGRLEQANGGTLFLDEIGDLDLALQGKLLRVLQEREFSPVGSDLIKRADVRVIAATNRDLKKEVRARTFREDLLYRLDVYNIQVPALRERSTDVSMLSDAFLAELRHEIGKPIDSVSAAALEALGRYPWPGNVRELRNAIERSLLSCRTRQIEIDDLPDKITGVQPAQPMRRAIGEPDNQSLDEWLADVERHLILDTLTQCNGIQAHAAKRLGISERSLWHRIKKLEIRVERLARDLEKGSE